jgi:CheY-like chemotaxis protein
MRAGGRAWLRSEPGSGTIVTLLLPAADGRSGLTGLAAGRPATAAEYASTVLVVDDEAAIRGVTHRVLTRAGYLVVTAAGQAEALGVLRDPGVHVDLLLTDVVMPGMTIDAFAAQARASRPGLRVLLMSGCDQPAALADGSSGSGTQVLAKPFSRAALLARVSQELSAHPGVPSPAGR